MVYSVYMQTNYYASYLVLLASFTLMVTCAVLINYIRKKYTERDYDIFEDSRYYSRRRPNPER